MNNTTASNTNKTVNEEEKIARARQCLVALGIVEASLFHHDSILRIQVPEADFERAVEIRETIVAQIKPIGYRFVALDFDAQEV